VTQDITKTV